MSNSKKAVIQKAVIQKAVIQKAVKTVFDKVGSKSKFKSAKPTVGKRLILVRHGESTANISGILAGRNSGILLTPKGEIEAKNVGHYLLRNDSIPHLIFYSPLERTKNTAKLINQVLSEASDIANHNIEHIKTIPMMVVGNFIEMDYGLWTGKSLKKLVKEKHWSEIQNSPSKFTFPKGESFIELHDRLIAGVENEILAKLQDGQTAVLVTHGDPIKIILTNFLGNELDNFQKLLINPGSISIINIRKDNSRVAALNISPSNDIPKASNFTLGGEVNSSDPKVKQERRVEPELKTKLKNSKPSSVDAKKVDKIKENHESKSRSKDKVKTKPNIQKVMIDSSKSLKKSINVKEK